MGRLGDPEWWWEYALDGVVGGVIGGLVTALAVWLTLRHERRMAERSRAAAEVAPIRQAGIELAAQLVRICTAVSAEVIAPGDTDALHLRNRGVEVFVSATSFWTVVGGTWPALAEELSAASNAAQALLEAGVRSDEDIDAALDALQLLVVIASAWMADATAFG